MEKTIFAATTLTAEHLTGKTFYVIDLFPYPQFVMDEDGGNKEFDTFEAAQAEADDCQGGIVAVF
ncbi:MAG TPA: hypothetical protein VG738_18610 [Chitinophagaceae bacterium]|nr:hypothetical protein [Chitinophagaceae bacterium]